MLCLFLKLRWRRQLLELVSSAIDSLRHVAEFHRFRRIVADAARRAQKNHGGGNFFRQYHGVVASPAHHPVWLASRFADGLFYLAYEKWIHGYSPLVHPHLSLAPQTPTSG